MKKIISIISILLVSVMILASCGDGTVTDTETQTTPITVTDVITTEDVTETETVTAADTETDTLSDVTTGADTSEPVTDAVMEQTETETETEILTDAETTEKATEAAVIVTETEKAAETEKAVTTAKETETTKTETTAESGSSEETAPAEENLYYEKLNAGKEYVKSSGLKSMTFMTSGFKNLSGNSADIYADGKYNPVKKAGKFTTTVDNGKTVKESEDAIKISDGKIYIKPADVPITEFFADKADIPISEADLNTIMGMISGKYIAIDMPKETSSYIIDTITAEFAEALKTAPASTVKGYHAAAFLDGKAISQVMKNIKTQLTNNKSKVTKELSAMLSSESSAKEFYDNLIITLDEDAAKYDKYDGEHGATFAVSYVEKTRFDHYIKLDVKDGGDYKAATIRFAAEKSSESSAFYNSCKVKSSDAINVSVLMDSISEVYHG